MHHLPLDTSGKKRTVAMFYCFMKSCVGLIAVNWALFVNSEKAFKRVCYDCLTWEKKKNHKNNLVSILLLILLLLLSYLKCYSLRPMSWFGEVCWSCKFSDSILRVSSYFTVILDLFRYVNLISSSILKKPILFWMSFSWEGRSRRLPRKTFSKPLNRQIFYRR